MKEGYGDNEVTLYPTQFFSVNNWALKPNQPKEPPFTDHMLAICAADKPVVFKSLKPSSITERVPQGTKPGAQLGHKKQSTSLKQPFVSRKESSSAMDSNPSQPPVSTTMDPGMHKEDQQATGGPTSLGVTGETRANPQLSSASFIIHSESASGNDASAVSIAEADLGTFAPSTDLHVLSEQTKSISEGLDTVLTQPLTGKEASSIARQVKDEEASRTIKLEDLEKLVSNVQPSFKDLDSPEDGHVIIVESDVEEHRIQIPILIIQSRDHELNLDFQFTPRRDMTREGFEFYFG
ncbi:hypothetical protein Tco_0703229 [Tanacetum coccineum]|uniref:Uncharacterized protein n=1 Tax=Tanacetum coccineum TaxID=301880 RepID=A0ABQ4XZS9_9ASTR